MLTSNPVSVPSSPAPRAVVAASMASIPRRLAAAATSLARSASGSKLSSADGKKGVAGGVGDREETKTTTAAEAEKERGELRTEGEAVLKQDLAGALCVAAVVGANISSGGLLAGSYWTAAVVVLSVILLLKILYDASRYYMLQQKKKSKEHVE
jgi:hypothetical protein